MHCLIKNMWVESYSELKKGGNQWLKKSFTRALVRGLWGSDLLCNEGGGGPLITLVCQGLGPLPHSPECNNLHHIFVSEIYEKNAGGLTTLFCQGPPISPTETGTESIRYHQQTRTVWFWAVVKSKFIWLEVLYGDSTLVKYPLTRPVMRVVAWVAEPCQPRELLFRDHPLYHYKWTMVKIKVKVKVFFIFVKV